MANYSVKKDQRQGRELELEDRKVIICVLSESLKKKQNNRKELVFKSIIQENFMEIETGLTLYTERAHWISEKMNPELSTLRHSPGKSLDAKIK